MTIKRIRPQEPIKLEDRLTSLPESLQLHILSSLEANYVVQTSVLSKSWFSLWKSVPILILDSSSFQKLPNFDKFVEKLVSQPLNVDTLIFERGGSSSRKILEQVTSFACSGNVKHLDVRIKRASWAVWADFLHGYPDSLKSLTLQSQFDVLCTYLGPQARFFKNLTELYLENATIHDLDPFSGFHVLNKLTLSGCKVDTSGSTLNIHSKHLSELSILRFGYAYYASIIVSWQLGSNKQLPKIDCIKLMTPKLRMFEYEGYDFPTLKTCDGLPNLDSLVIGSAGFSVHNEKRKFDSLMMFFMKVYNVKSLKVCPAIVYMLGAFPAELVNRCTPFQDLKSLTLDSGHCHFHSVHGRGHRGHDYWTYEGREDAHSNVKDYLLRKSPVANFISKEGLKR